MVPVPTSTYSFRDRWHVDAPPDVIFDLPAARRTRAYWCLIALHSVHGMVFAAVMFHRVQIFEDRGHTVGQAAMMFAMFSFCAAGMQFVGGFMADRLPLRFLLACTSFCTAVGLLILGVVDGIAGALTPVPGGVGPMTIAMLVENTIEAAERSLST